MGIQASDTAVSIHVYPMDEAKSVLKKEKENTCKYWRNEIYERAWGT